MALQALASRNRVDYNIQRMEAFSLPPPIGAGQRSTAARLSEL